MGNIVSPSNEYFAQRLSSRIQYYTIDPLLNSFITSTHELKEVTFPFRLFPVMIVTTYNWWVSEIRLLDIKASSELRDVEMTLMVNCANR